MKTVNRKILLVAIFSCLCFIAQAQTTLSITAGGLKDALNGKTDVTDLVITGTMNAYDFRTIMLLTTLKTIDLSGVTKIEAFTTGGGKFGPDANIAVYPENEIPQSSFYQVKQITAIKLPTNAGITSIGKQAFGECVLVTSLIIPEGITTIGDYAFTQAGITSITLPESATNWVGKGIFLSCSKLTQVSLPSKLTVIPDVTFYNTNLNAISIPATVTTIGNQAFQANKNLKEIVLPAGLQQLGGFRTFAGTGISKLDIPAATIIRSVDSDGEVSEGSMYETFNGCANLTSVNIPANVKTILDNVFSGTDLRTIIIPEGVTEIGSAFRNCAKLESIEIPNSVITLGSATFYSCTALKSVTLKGEKLTTLGYGTFNGCSALISLEIPAGVTTINDNAFQNCSGLTLLKMNNPAPVIFTNQKNVFAGVNKANCVLEVPAGSKKDYSELDLWKDFTNIKEVGGVSKQDQTISGLTNLAKKVGDPTFDLLGTAQTTVAYNSSNTAVATISGKTVTIVGVGTTTITASAAENETYNAATDVKITLTVNKGDQIISGLSDIAKTVGDADLTLAAAASSKLLVTYSIKDNSIATLTNGVLHFLKAGTTTITASQAGNINYNAATDLTVNLTVSAKAKTVQTITGLTDITAKVGDADVTLAAAASSKLPVMYSIKDNTIATLTNGVLHFLKAGTTTITASQAGDDTYAAADVTVNLTVSAKTAQTITGLTDITVKMGDTDVTLAAAASSKLPVMYSIKDNSIATLTNGVLHFIKAGTTTITASQAGDATYAAAPDVTINLTVGDRIKTAQTITGLTDITVKMGDADVTLTAIASSKLGVTYKVNDTSIATITNGVLHFLKEGATTITASQAGDDIYVAAPDVTVNLTVSINYSWLLAPAIAIEGTNLKVVGTDADKFTLFYINDQAVTATAGVVSLAGKTGDLSLKVTTADGTGFIKQKVSLTPKVSANEGTQVFQIKQ